MSRPSDTSSREDVPLFDELMQAMDEAIEHARTGPGSPPPVGRPSPTATLVDQVDATAAREALRTLDDVAEPPPSGPRNR